MISKVKPLVPSKFEVFKNLLNRKSKVIPKSKQVFAVGTGTYVGEMLVYVKKDMDNYYFLSIPKNINRSIPIDKFDFAMEHKIAELAHTLPGNIYKLCCAQFKYNSQNSGSHKVSD